MSDEEKRLFLERHGDLQDGRFYPRYFCRTEPFKLSPETIRS